MNAEVPDLTFQSTPHFIMLFSILCICEAFKARLRVNLPIPLSTASQYVSQLKDGAVSPETNAFLQQQVKRVAGERGTITGFKAVVCAEHVLVAFCFTADSSSAALGNLHTEKWEPHPFYMIFFLNEILLKRLCTISNLLTYLEFEGHIHLNQKVWYCCIFEIRGPSPVPAPTNTRYHLCLSTEQGLVGRGTAGQDRGSSGREQNWMAEQQ